MSKRYTVHPDVTPRIHDTLSGDMLVDEHAICDELNRLADALGWSHVATPATDRPADMPPWIVDRFPVDDRIWATVWSDGDVEVGGNGESALFARPWAIVMCRRILAILEGGEK